MTKTFKILLSVILLTLFVSGALYGQEQVANVVSVEGNLYIQSLNSSDWTLGGENTPLYLDDKLKTDANSYANIEFLSGSLISVNQNTTIQITGIKDATDVTERSFIQNVIITSGEIWAKITQQQEEIEFQTNGGTVAIKGTEFVIEEDPDKEETYVSVLEGTVAFRDKDNNETLYNAGEQVKIALQKIEEVKKFLPQELRKELEDKLDANFINLLNKYLNNLPVDPNNIGPDNLPFDPNNIGPNNLPVDPNNIGPNNNTPNLPYNHNNNVPGFNRSLESYTDR